MTLAISTLFLLQLGVGLSCDCPDELFVHAKQLEAPIPDLRPLGCDDLGPPVIEIIIGGNGEIEEVEFLKSSGCVSADRSLEECLTQWRYEPATCASEPVSETITVVVHWHLEERDTEDNPCA